MGKEKVASAWVCGVDGLWVMRVSSGKDEASRPDDTSSPLPSISPGWTCPRSLLAMDLAPSSASTLQLSSISVLSPTNHPLYLRSFPSSPQADLAHSHLTFAALDYVDDAVANGSGGGAGKEGYLGLLLVVEDTAV